MKKQMVQWSSGLVVLALLAACGGGGGGGGETAGTATSATVSGTVVAASTASASKAAAITDGVAVQLTSYDTGGNKLGEAVLSSDANGGFSTQLNLSSAGGSVVLTATKEGYSQYQKRITYTTPGNLELQAALERIAFTQEVAVNQSNSTVIGKSAEPSFEFAVFRYANGTKKAVAGKAAILAAKSAADATLEMGLSIPAASLPNVTSIDVKASTYDPATNTLPGSYSATGKDGKEGTMVSLAFDYLDLKANGQNLGEVAKALVKSGVTKAAAATTTYKRSIYSSSCKNLFAYDDYNLTAPGRQVPVWSLNPSTGKWVFIGEGTVTDSSGSTITAPSETGCGNGGYYLTIQVANTEFQNNYWNLDHIIYDTPTRVCLTGKLAAGTTPLANLSLYLYGGNLDSTWGRTDATGNYTLETAVLNKKDSSRSGTLSFYDQDGRYQSLPVNLNGTYPSCAVADKTDFPISCTVSGKLVDESGNGISYRTVTLRGKDTWFYKGIGTDSAGAFSSRVKCGETIDVYAGAATASASCNVNGVAEANEATDNGSAVALNNITAPNMAPTGYAYFASSSINLNKTSSLTAAVTGKDADNNYPLNWTIKFNGVEKKSGTITATDKQPVLVTISGLTEGTYPATYQLTDSKGSSSVDMNMGYVTVTSGTRAPVTQLYASTNYVRACGGSRNVTLYGYANDADGDGMTGVWSMDPSGNSVPGCSSTAASAGYTLSGTCTTDLPQGAGPFVYRYTVTDSTGKSSYASASISTYNNAPVVTIKADKNLVPVGSAGAARTVTLYATATDPDGDTITGGTWSVDGTPLTSCTGLTCSYTIPAAATAGQTFKFTYTASDCAAYGSNSASVVYGDASPVTIVIQ